MARLSILPAPIDEYLARFTAKRHPVLKEMEALAEKIRFNVGGGRTIAFPIIGPLVGQLVAHYARLIGAKRVFELGSGYGYSAFWFAQAMGPAGKVICTESREDNKQTAYSFLKKAGLHKRVEYRIGDGMEFLQKERSSSFDIIFIDMEKQRYPLGFRTALPKLRRGGLLIADNVLWSGEVLKPSSDPSTRGLQKFTRLITGSKRMLTVIHPLRDGVSVSLKIA